jgi:alpha/beta superfamily hydrolase
MAASSSDWSCRPTSGAESVNAQTERLRLAGTVGAIEALRDHPAAGTAPRGVALIAHPHPLFGGTMDNKVVQTLARACVQCGWTAVRFNFRGVGASEGAHDEGRGEADDMQALVDQVALEGPLVLAGFSFGAFVASQVAARLWPARALEALVLVGTAASRFNVARLPEALHERTLVIHGEQDDTVPLSAVLDWARPQSLPVTVIPGGGHFFHGQLPLLKSLVLRHLR